ERRSIVCHETPERLDKGLIAFSRRAAALDDRAALPRRENQEWVLPEERIAPHVLAALDALQEERVVGVLGDLEKCRDGRQKVCDELLAARHERAAPRQTLELIKRGDFHGVQPPRAASARPRA